MMDDETEALLMTPAGLRAWRTEKGLSQARLARRLGVSPRYMKYLESGVNAHGTEMKVPRYIALACRGLEAALSEEDEAA